MVWNMVLYRDPYTFLATTNFYCHLWHVLLRTARHNRKITLKCTFNIVRSNRQHRHASVNPNYITATSFWTFTFDPNTNHTTPIYTTNNGFPLAAGWLVAQTKGHLAQILPHGNYQTVLFRHSTDTRKRAIKKKKLLSREQKRNNAKNVRRQLLKLRDCWSCCWEVQWFLST